MKRAPALFLATVVGVVATGFAASAALERMLPHDASPAHVLSLAIAQLAPPTADAQQVLDFKPLPPESVSALERPARRHAPVPAAPTAPTHGTDTLAPPVPPVPPAHEVGSSGDIVRFGSNIHVEDDETVRGDVVAIGGQVEVDGHVEGNVVAIGGDVVLNASARVDGDVVCMGGELHEAPGSTVGGQRVTAARRFHGAGWLPFIGMFGAGLGAAWALVWTLIIAFMVWAIFKLAPTRSAVAFHTLKTEPAMSLGIGFLLWILLIPSVIALALVVALLCITIIGIPLGIGVLMAYVAFLIVLMAWGYAVAAAALGERLAQRLKRGNTDLALAAMWGALLIGAVHVVGHLFGVFPIAGVMGVMLRIVVRVAVWVLITLGAGALLRCGFGAGSLGKLWAGRRGPQPVASAAPAAPVAYGAAVSERATVVRGPAPDFPAPPPPAEPPPPVAG